MGFHIEDCYGHRGCDTGGYHHPSRGMEAQVLELYRNKPRAEPPGLDFTQHSPVQRAESLPILHSKLLGSIKQELIEDLCNPSFHTLWLWKT